MRRNRPSVTARWIAAQRARLADTRPTVPHGDPNAERRLYEAMSRLFVLPGLAPTGMAMRTMFFDRETVEAIRRGVDQIVIVGAGYDGRSLRFGGSGVRWIEVDHPSTQSDKRHRLAALGVTSEGTSFAAVDLMTDDLGSALSKAGHAEERSTLFICEGLFAYLPLGVSRSLCRTLRIRAARGSVLAANFLVAPAGGVRAHLLRGAVDLVLSYAGELRVSDFAPGDPEDLVQSAGWHILRRDASKPSRLDEGSHLLVVAAEPAGQFH